MVSSHWHMVVLVFGVVERLKGSALLRDVRGVRGVELKMVGCAWVLRVV